MERLDNKTFPSATRQLDLIDNQIQLAKFLKKNMYGKKIVIGMGAGSISNWMKKLPQLM